MSTKEELKELLRKINSADDVERVKPEIKEKLRDINPADLSRAEQELAEEEEIGVEQIRKLCEPHLEIIEEKEIKDKFDEMGYTFFTPGLEENEDEDEVAKTSAEYKTGEELDFRETPPSERHPVFFEKFDGLETGQKLVLINDHEPTPLFYEMKVVRADTFDLESYEVFERGKGKFEAHFPKKGSN